MRRDSKIEKDKVSVDNGMLESVKILQNHELGTTISHIIIVEFSSVGWAKYIIYNDLQYVMYIISYGPHYIINVIYYVYACSRVRLYVYMQCEHVWVHCVLQHVLSL